MLYSLLTPQFEQDLFLESYWMVYIFGVIQAGLLLFNHDIHLGRAAVKLDAYRNGIVDAIVWSNTVISMLTVVTYSTFSAFAE